MRPVQVMVTSSSALNVGASAAAVLAGARGAGGFDEVDKTGYGGVKACLQASLPGLHRVQVIVTLS